MTQPPLPELELSELRLGHYVILDLGWMAHPFARSSFLITSQHEIDTLRSLKLQRVRFDPSRSELQEAVGAQAPSPAGQATSSEGPLVGVSIEAPMAADAPSAVDEHRAAQKRAERHFLEGARCFKAVAGLVEKQPELAAAESKLFVHGLMAEMSGHGESAIRLLDQVMGDRHAQHAVNVMVLCLLLGKAVGLSETEIDGLGQAAFLHDVGKLKLPTQVRNLDESLTPAQRKAYEGHVAHGVEIGRSMKLGNGALQAMAQHHEAVDGTGFPTGCKGERISRQAQVLALVNRYDGLCNPWNPARSLTPHEAISRLFSTMRAKFDAPVLQAFIRMMGVYPPGSIVQLTDGRFAQVHVVNASRPLKPVLLVHEPSTQEQPFQVLDLGQLPGVSVQRSLRADQLPRAVLNALAPGARYCYFFERAVHGTGAEGHAT